MATESYNYRHFRPSHHAGEQLMRFVGPRAGERFVDLNLTDADGNAFRMSQTRGRTVVLETGSLSCPTYVRNIDAMARLKERFPEVTFLVLYVREEHPGRRLHEHRSFEEKRALARQLYSEEHEHRRVLVDDLGGRAHRALGGLPNMVYVVGPDGVVRFRADWAHPRAVEAVLEQRDALITRERFDPSAAPAVALRVLLRAGVDALFDFVRGLPGLVRLRRQMSRAR